jgi:ribosomal-protein-alanine N-acetyltransferase
MAQSGRDFALAIIHNGDFVGGITLGNVTWGSARNAYIGYWIDSSRAGMGITPTAVAILSDWAILIAGLHRIEISIRPENSSSLRVVEKLGFKEEGYRARFLHIDNDWRDHIVYVITEDQVRQQTLTSRRPLIHSRHSA